jgi:DNA-binding protein H-NS
MASYKELLEQQQALAIQIEEARKRELADAVARVQAIVAEYGLTADDIFSGRKSGRRATATKVPPKYRNPITGQTWTGRGKAPKWIEGRDRDQFLIAPAA